MVGSLTASAAWDADLCPDAGMRDILNAAVPTTFYLLQ